MSAARGEGSTPSERLAKFARVWSERGSALRGDTVYQLETGDDGSSVLNVSDVQEILRDRDTMLLALQWIAGRKQTGRWDEVEVWELQERAVAAVRKATTAVEPNSVGTPQGVNQK